MKLVHPFIFFIIASTRTHVVRSKPEEKPEPAIRSKPKEKPVPKEKAELPIRSKPKKKPQPQDDTDSILKPTDEAVASFTLDNAKLAIQGTIDHYLKTGEWKQMECPFTHAPSEYVYCFQGLGEGLNTRSVLHPMRPPGTTIGEANNTLVTAANQAIIDALIRCDCDHNHYQTIASYFWPDTTVVKTALVSKIYANERTGESYDPCSPPEDVENDVFFCGMGIDDKFLSV